MDAVQCAVPSDWIGGFSQCLYDWQGLEAGLLALAAAIFGVRYVQKQIQQTQTHRTDEISRRHNAARLTLPLALSSIAEMIQKIADNVANEFEKYGPDGFSKSFDEIVEEGKLRTKFEPVVIPKDVFGSLEDFVASLSEKHDIRHVAELVGSIQILLSRYNDFNLNQVGVQSGLIELLLDAAKVKLLNEKLFNYARFVDDGSFGIVGVISPTDAWSEIHGNAERLVFGRESPDIFFSDFKQSIRNYKEQGTSPWIEKFAVVTVTSGEGAADSGAE